MSNESRPDFRTEPQAISTHRPQVRTSVEFFGVKARGDLSTRVDRSGPPALTPNQEYAAINAGAQPRGPVQRRHISAAEAAANTATAAAQAAGPGVYSEVIAALKVELEAQRELATQQAAQIQQLLERLDALDGNQSGEAA